MIVPLKGMTRYQGEPTHATLRVEYLSRLEDGQGNASPGVFDYYAAPADLAAGIWRDEHNRASEAALIVNDLGVRGTPLRFTETFYYPDQVTVENTYLRNSTPTNLDGTEYDYTEAQAVQLVGPSGVPLTWQAAQEFIGSGGTLLTDIETNLSALDTVLADIEQSQAQMLANGSLTPVATEAALIGKPAGGYRIVATNEAVVWSGAAVTARGPAAPTLLDVPGRTASVAALAGIRPGPAVTGLTALMRAQAAANRSLIEFEAGDYTLSETMLIDVHHAHLRGQGGSDWVGNGAVPSGTILRPGAGLTEIIKVTGSAGLVGAFSFAGLSMVGAGRTADGVRFEMGNGPARPVNWQDFTFVGLNAGIRSVTPAGKATGIFNLNLPGITMRSNNYGLLGQGTGSFGNLNISGAVIEQNVLGGIRIEAATNGGMFGANSIRTSLMEGQPDPIVINGGLYSIELAQNYFEANTGRIRLSATNTNSQIIVDPQYVHNCPELFGEFEIGQIWLREKLLTWRAKNNVIREWLPAVLGVNPDVTDPTLTFNQVVPRVLSGRTPPPGVVRIENATGDVLDTAVGRERMRLQTAAFAGYMDPGLTTSGTQAIVAAAPARRSGSTPAAVGALWNASGATLASGAALLGIPDGEDIINVAILTGVAAGITPRFRWMTDADVLIGPTTFYAVTIPASTATLAQKAQAGVPLYLAPAPAPAARTTLGSVTGLNGISANGYGRWSLALSTVRYVRTPTGPRRVVNIPAGGNSGGVYLNLGVGQTAAQVVRATPYIRVVGGGTANLTINTINQASAPLASGVTLQVSGSDWTPYTLALPVDSANSGNAPATATRLRVSSDVEVEISDMGGYTADPAIITAANAPLFLPLTHEVTLPVTIPAGQTSVAVPHKLSYIPGVVTASAAANVQAWVSPLVDSVNVTVNIATAQGTDTVVNVGLSG